MGRSRHLLHCIVSLSRIQLFVTPQTVAYQAPLSMGLSRQEYWSGLPFPSPGANATHLKLRANKQTQGRCLPPKPFPSTQKMLEL